jgi:hypothetical protein
MGKVKRKRTSVKNRLAVGSLLKIKLFGPLSGVKRQHRAQGGMSRNKAPLILLEDKTAGPGDFVLAQRIDAL